MSMTVNKTMIFGYLGKDPEIRFTQSGTKQFRCSVATSESFKDASSGTTREHTDWHTLVAFGRKADFLEGLKVTKGSRVYAEGSTHYRHWEDARTHQHCSATEIYIERFIIVGKPGAGDMAQEAPNATFDDSELCF